MSTIKIPIHFEGSLGEKTGNTLFSSGATYSCVSPRFLDSIAIPVKLFRSLNIDTIAINHFYKVTEAVRLDFYFNDIRMSDEFMVIPGLSEDVIIGVNTLQKWRIKLDFEHDTVIVDPKVAKAILK